MILNTTYLDKEKKKLIIQKVGKSLSLWDSIFNTIKGSHRMIIDSYSSGFEGFLRKDNNILYASIENRNLGIIVRISNNYETISWLIPFYKLGIYKSRKFSIHSEGQYIKFRIDKNYIMNKRFISNMFELKVQYNNQYKAKIS